VTAVKSPRSERQRLALITAIIKYLGKSDQCSIRILVNRFARQVLARTLHDFIVAAAGKENPGSELRPPVDVSPRLVLVPIRYGF
jgi:hypothetical protein